MSLLRSVHLLLVGEHTRVDDIVDLQDLTLYSPVKREEANGSERSLGGNGREREIRAGRKGATYDELGGEDVLLSLRDQRVDDVLDLHVCASETKKGSKPSAGGIVGGNPAKGQERARDKRNEPLSPRPIQSIPSLAFFSSIWRDLTSARVSMGERPEFSARARGMASRAEAKARMAYCSIDGIFVEKKKTEESDLGSKSKV
jgi:hypothetical protein